MIGVLQGMLDDRIVEIDVPNSPAQQVSGALTIWLA